MFILHSVHVACTQHTILDSTISAVKFADFGLPKGDCDDGWKTGAVCGTPDLAAAVAAHCVGHATCTLECSDYANLHQHGCNITTDGDKTATQVTSTPPCAVSKTVVLDVSCGGAVPCVGLK